MAYQIDTLLSKLHGKARRFFGIRLDGALITASCGANWSTTHDKASAFSVATVPLLKPIALSAGRHTLAIYADWTNASTLVFTGEITSKADTYYPAGSTLTAGGYLSRTNEPIAQAATDQGLTDADPTWTGAAFYYASGTDEETQSLLDQIDPLYQAVPITTDADIIIFGLERHGITPATTNHHIEASPAQVARIVPIFWEPTQSFWEVIRKLDELSPNYATFDARGGEVRRQPVFGTVPNPKYTFYGRGAGSRNTRTILDFSVDTSYQVWNQVIVRGAAIESTGETVTGISPVGGPVASPYIPTPPGVRADASIQNDWIETVSEAQRVADERLGRLQEPLQTLNLTVPGCPDFDVADGVRVETSGWSGNTFIAAHTLQGAPFQSTFTLQGSTFAVPRPNQPPMASLLWSVIVEQVLVAGTATPIAWISFDASASSDSDGTIASMALDVAGDTYPLDPASPFITIGYEGSPPVLATLTVTDDGGLSDTLSVQVSWDAASASVEPLTLAEQDDGAVSVDGDVTWDTFTASVISLPPINASGALIYGGSGGQIWRSEDDLATVPTLTTTLPAAINCMWKNEQIAGRVLAGLDNGDIWLSSDDGVTWTKTGALPTAINDISESPFLAGQATISSGASVWSTFDLATFTPLMSKTGATALRHVGGPTALYGGWDDGTLQRLPTESSTATTISGITGAIRGLGMEVKRERVLIGTDHSTGSGYATWFYSPTDGLTAGPNVGTAVNHLIHSGAVDELFYVGTDGSGCKILRDQVWEFRVYPA